MLTHQGHKLLAAIGLVGELIAYLSSQPVLGAISFVGTVISAASAWYWSEKGRKRRDRREEHLERASEEILASVTRRIKKDMEEGKDDPFPELTRMLIEMRDGPAGS